MPEERVHLGIVPGLSPVVGVAHALADGPHQAAVLIAVLTGRHLHDCVRHRGTRSASPDIPSVNGGLLSFLQL